MCLVSSLRARRLRPARRHFHFVKVFVLAMKRCLIASTIAGSIGFLPCCVLKEYERLPDL